MASLSSRVVSGVKWSVASALPRTLLQLGTVAWLTHLIGPKEFGIMGMLMVVVALSQTVADMGLSNALIQRPDVPRRHFSSVFWLNLAVGILFGCLLLLAREPISAYFKEPSLTGYLVWMAAVFPLAALGQQLAVVNQKELAFRRLTVAELVAAFLYSASSLSLAYLGYGVLALVWGHLLRVALRTLCLFALSPRCWWPTLHFRLSDVRSYLRFGLFQSGERATNFLASNLDSLLIGRLLGAEALGIYRLAFQLATLPLTRVSPLLSRVAFPALSMLQNDLARQRSGYLKLLTYSTLIGFPISAGIAVASAEIVDVAYGPGWVAAAPVLQVLSTVVFFKSAAASVGPVLLARGRADLGLLMTGVQLVLVALAIGLGNRWGLLGVAVALAFAQVPLSGFVHWITNRQLQLPWVKFFGVLAPLVMVSVAMVLSAEATRRLSSSLASTATLVLVVMVGSLTYLFLSWHVMPNTLRELMVHVRGRSG